MTNMVTDRQYVSVERWEEIKKEARRRLVEIEDEEGEA